uniref:Uncharacterized protein n=1 Tax=Zea mays TaxID=4577 RepID=A0A804RM32_MAIZE
MVGECPCGRGGNGRWGEKEGGVESGDQEACATSSSNLSDFGGMDFLFTIVGFLTACSVDRRGEKNPQRVKLANCELDLRFCSATCVDLDSTLNELGDGEDTQGSKEKEKELHALKFLTVESEQGVDGCDGAIRSLVLQLREIHGDVQVVSTPQAEELVCKVGTAIRGILCCSLSSSDTCALIVCGGCGSRRESIRHQVHPHEVLV